MKNDLSDDPLKKKSTALMMGRHYSHPSLRDLSSSHRSKLPRLLISFIIIVSAIVRYAYIVRTPEIVSSSRNLITLESGHVLPIFIFEIHGCIYRSYVRCT